MKKCLYLLVVGAILLNGLYIGLAARVDTARAAGFCDSVIDIPQAECLVV